MNFDYNEEQQLLADSVRRFLAQGLRLRGAAARSSLRPRAGAPTVWAHVRRDGPASACRFAAEHGGFGGGAVDLMGVMEAFGEALVVEPYLPTLLGARLRSRAAAAGAAGAILPAVVEGKMKLAFAHTEPGARYDLAASDARHARRATAGRSTARRRGVVGAPMADTARGLARTRRDRAGIALFLVDTRRAGCKPYRTLDELRAADIVFSAARRPSALRGRAAARSRTRPTSPPRWSAPRRWAR